MPPRSATPTHAARRDSRSSGASAPQACQSSHSSWCAEALVSPGYLHVPDETAMRLHWRTRRDELDAAFERFLSGAPPYRLDE